jgi:phosphoribosylanthranilate isomerase
MNGFYKQVKGMFQIKICGITRHDDAVAAATAGADAVGLNFYPRSPRYVSLQQAQAIAAALPANVKKVGVFVNDSAAEIRRIAQGVPLDYVQLHGDEPPDLIADLAPLRVIRAWRLNASTVPQLLQWLQNATVTPEALLIDALAVDSPGGTAYGGTGKTVDWNLLATLRQAGITLPLILAGGLTPNNISVALQTAQPAAVDTASGVESSPGVKDVEKMREFVRLAKAYFAAKKG